MRTFLTIFNEVLVDRREFLAATAVAAVSPLPHLNTLSQSAPRQYFELRRYHLLPGTKQRAFIDFIGSVAIPAMNRAGVGKVGAFTVVYGENAPSLLLVLAHQTLDTVVSLRDRLANDAVYARAGAAILEAPMSDPAFVRVESTLLRAFDAMPTLEPSAGAGTATPRIFELRTYESHSDRAALNKLKMFNAGEVPIFRRAGLTPVFFGETVIGANMPSLTYMLTFSNMSTRDAAWAAFGQDPEWKTLSADPQYRDNVSAISDIILQPTAYSQI
ncbi:MAG TPA: NIPSNAP family protein [Gemmatimonadaceae bacterium]